MIFCYFLQYNFYRWCLINIDSVICYTKFCLLKLTYLLNSLLHFVQKVSLAFKFLYFYLQFLICHFSLRLSLLCLLIRCLELILPLLFSWLCHVRLFVTRWITVRQASLSFTISWSLLKLVSIESVMPSKHPILCHPLLLPSIFPSIRVFSNESALHITWPKYRNVSFSISLD